MESEEMAAGTIIEIPMSADQFAVAQVVYGGIVFYLVVFGEILRPGDKINMNTLTPLIASWTNDAEIYKGRWRIIGRSAITKKNFPRPNYKVNINGAVMVESFDRKRIRLAKNNEESGLKYRSSRSPVILEEALMAHHKLKPWKDYYRDLLIS